MKTYISAPSSNFFGELLLRDLPLIQKRPLLINSLYAIVEVLAISCAFQMNYSALPLL